MHHFGPWYTGRGLGAAEENGGGRWGREGGMVER